MRLRERDLKTVYLKKRLVDQDDENNDIVSYAAEAIKLNMTVQSAGGQVAAAIYGERLPYIKSCKYQGNELKPKRNENDGICLYVDSKEEPDFYIKSIQPFSTHLNVTLEMRDQDES